MTALPEAPAITAARIEVERRRGAALETIAILQARLAPRTLAADAWELAKNKGADLAEDAVDAVKSRPVAVGGAVAAIALFLARQPIRDAAAGIYDALTSSGATKAPPAALNPQNRKRKKSRTNSLDQREAREVNLENDHERQ